MNNINYNIKYIINKSIDIMNNSNNIYKINTYKFFIKVYIKFVCLLFDLYY